MRDLGRAAAMAAAAATALALGGCVQGVENGAGEPSEPKGFVILDREAREAGVRLEGVAAEDAVLPVEVSPTAQYHLALPAAGRTPLEIGEDEVVYVHGRNAQVDRGALDHEIARDRVYVDGPESAADALAEEIGGVVESRAGSLMLIGPDAVAELARASTPEGLAQILPVNVGDTANLPAFANAQGLFHDGDVPQRALQTRSFDWPAFIAPRLSEPADALLPASVSCADPIVGTWVSREHYPSYGDWYRFELIVRRDPRDPAGLVGMIRSRSWSGGADLATPTSCEGTSFDWTVGMSADGRFDGQAVSFDGETRSTESTRCGAAYDASCYNRDHFTGQLVEGGRFLAAMNNDGGRAVDEPHLFRRVACR